MTTNFLFPVDGTFSFCGYRDFVESRFFGILYRTVIDGDNEYCYDKDCNLIAFYDGKNKELYATVTD